MTDIARVKAVLSTIPTIRRCLDASHAHLAGETVAFAEESMDEIEAILRELVAPKPQRSALLMSEDMEALLVADSEEPAEIEKLSKEEEDLYRSEVKRLSALCKFTKNTPVMWVEPLTCIDEITRTPVWSSSDKHLGSKCRNLRIDLKLCGSEVGVILGEGFDGLILLEDGGARVQFEAYEQLLKLHAGIWPRLFKTHEEKFRAAGLSG